MFLHISYLILSNEHKVVDIKIHSIILISFLINIISYIKIIIMNIFHIIESISKNTFINSYQLP
jgi:hypothetical protein